MDRLAVELQSYDATIFTETWLSPNVLDDDLLIPNFDPLYSRDRPDRPDCGVAIYIESGLSFQRRVDLIHNIVEGLSIEIYVRYHKYLLC